ncbi:MAG TPA: hypothetical protein VL096_19395 [Pirellulaceae bacterium]|nr:hypothetical protein [Pirellulaceae bacterium]
MDPLHLAIAFVPLAGYLLLLGIINLSPRPFVTTGIRDGLALAIGLSGLVVVGPLELFLPERAASTFGPYVWLLLLALYLLTSVLVVLMGRPRLIIYNSTPTELKPILDRVVKQLDPSSSTADETYVLPQLFVQLHVEAFHSLRNVSLVAIGPRQSWQGWKKLEGELVAALKETRGTTNPYGLTLLMFGAVLAGLTTYWLANDRQAVAQALWEMLRL